MPEDKMPEDKMHEDTIPKDKTAGGKKRGRQLDDEKLAAKNARETRQIAGYLRLSSVIFPAGCQAGPEHERFLQEVRAPRAAYLTEVAARHNLEISGWYEDFDLSGRGEYLAERKGFEALTQAARAGNVRIIFAADLSRLFRDLMQQELWFHEMETLGVTVEVPDLPFALDDATRLLMRQEIGMINEYVSSRMGAIISANHSRRVEQGLWVGRSRSQWGLAYDSALKGFVRDEATARNIQHVYETFNAHGGNAYRTAKHLNAEVQLGAPGAVGSVNGGPWEIHGVLYLVRKPLYRRIATLPGVAVPAPHLIPEIISPEVLAVTDRLLAEQAEFHAKVADWLAVDQAPLPYSKRLFCEECGAMFQAYRHECFIGVSPGPCVSWVCHRAASGGLRPGLGCAARAKLPQYRLHALLSRCLPQLFQADKDAYQTTFPSLSAKILVTRRQMRTQKGRLLSEEGIISEGGILPKAKSFGETRVSSLNSFLDDSLKSSSNDSPNSSSNDSAEVVLSREEYVRQVEQRRHAETVRRQALRKRKTQLRCGLKRNRSRRARLLDEFASGLIEDRAWLEGRLARLSKSTAALEEALRIHLHEEGDRGWRGTAVGKLCTRFEAVWPGDWWQRESPERGQLIEDLDIHLIVRILPRAQPRKTAPRSRSKTGAPYYERKLYGLCEITLSSSTLNIAADAPVVFCETDEELSEYTRLRRLDPNTLLNPLDPSVVAIPSGP